MDVSENQRSGLNAALRTLWHHYPVVLEKKISKIRPILTLKKMLWDFQIHLKPHFFTVQVRYPFCVTLHKAFQLHIPYMTAPEVEHR